MKRNNHVIKFVSVSYVNLRPKQIFFHQFVHRFSLEFVVCFPKILAVCVMASFGEQNRVSNNQRSTLEFYDRGMVSTGEGGGGEGYRVMIKRAMAVD